MWEIFYQMTLRPRPSGHEQAVIDYVESLCHAHQLTLRKDTIGNLIISKPATPGMEERKGIVMQGHLDMVPQKNADSTHDFESDPIQTCIEDGWVTAVGTTLGADNGIGVAAALAVMTAKDIEHGPLEVLLTIDEEAGMTGASNLEAGILQGDILLNLDTEDEGELYVGCAGGIDISALVDMQWQPLEGNYQAFELAVTGLRGGHSGLDIDKGRGNANKIANRFLLENYDKLNMKVCQFNGGTLRNAIPRESFTQILVPVENVPAFESAVTQFKEEVTREYGSVETNLSIALKSIDAPSRSYSDETCRKVIHSVAACINGVSRMSQEFNGVVETSNNLAIVKTEGDQVAVKCLTRSLSNSARDALAAEVAASFKAVGAATQLSGDYPGWKPNPDSKILITMIEGYQRLYGVKPEVKVIHAGLECGLLSEPYPHWDMISFGPTIRHAHSPDEKVEIATVEKFWVYLLDSLKHAPLK
nr:aminoacyl-histidine dipeptidase [Aliikangiella sp. G2MR2-5]